MIRTIIVTTTDKYNLQDSTVKTFRVKETVNNAKEWFIDEFIKEGAEKEDFLEHSTIHLVPMENIMFIDREDCTTTVHLLPQY